jgi:hypothetical protein
MCFRPLFALAIRKLFSIVVSRAAEGSGGTGAAHSEAVAGALLSVTVTRMREGIGVTGRTAAHHSGAMRPTLTHFLNK